MELIQHLLLLNQIGMQSDLHKLESFGRSIHEIENEWQRKTLSQEPKFNH